MESSAIVESRLEKVSRLDCIRAGMEMAERREAERVSRGMCRLGDESPVTLSVLATAAAHGWMASRFDVLDAPKSIAAVRAYTWRREAFVVGFVLFTRGLQAADVTAEQ